MKITVLRNLGPGLPDYTEGQVLDVSDTEGAKLVKYGLAIQAIPKKSAITAPKKEVELDSGNSDSQKQFKSKAKSKK